MKLSQLLKISALSLTLLSIVNSAAKASSLDDYLSTKSNVINTCLTNAMGVDSDKSVGADTRIEDASLDKISTCLSPAIQQMQSGIEIEAKFENAAFSNYATISGEFTFAPTAIEDGVVSAEELNNFRALISPNTSRSIFDGDAGKFDLEARSCSLRGLDSFSYTPDANYVALLKVGALSVAANEVATRNKADTEAAALTGTLATLQAQLAGADSSLKLSLNCESRDVEVAVVDGLASATIDQYDRYRLSGSFNIPEGYSLPRYSSRLNFSASDRTETITVNGQTLKIKTERRNDNLQISYQGLPLVVGNERVRRSST